MNPIIPLAGVGIALLLAMKGKSAHAAPSATYSSAPPDRTPTPEPAPTSKKTSEMPELLKQQLVLALSKLGVRPLVQPGQPPLDGRADANAIRYASQVAGQLSAQGYHEAAADLRKYIAMAEAQVATPPEAAPIAKAAPPGLTAAQKEHLARAMAMERDPARLLSLINWLKALPPSPERDSNIAMVQAIRLQVLEALSTAETLQKIDEVIKSPTEEKVAEAAKPPPPVPAPTLPPKMMPAPAPTVVKTPPILPEAPVAVPKSPEPQPLPAPVIPPPKSAAEKAAFAMVDHLRAIESQYGGPKAAKGRQNKALVKAFQSAVGAKADGLPGPATLYAAAGKGAVELPLVMYWPKSATTKTVQTYRDQLSRLASALDGLGRGAEANTLRMSIARERGQGGVAGGLLKV